ncbi:hypothetical protein N825_03885 [Skermanella stibiiresistens SB22]|uniref:Glycosyl hydrolase family 5 n=1 Tax=Skermanella stibiiresistens SB22 TaxID=1385369 RepID=W9H1T0_9PROT|nr:DUF2155 domain-containing protein [Skermanella stibiiresistens]EWY40115.1 hypothetical protein N825_03885 [Skermanella stibiiresistens SB22]
MFNRKLLAALTGLALSASLSLALSPALAQTGASEGMTDMPLAMLQGLDKVTARVVTLEAPVGQTVSFGSLRITARACREASPVEPPESAAFLEIREEHPDEATEALFSGWMFASSPALSALEHPVYDVWVIDCK